MIELNKDSYIVRYYKWFYNTHYLTTYFCNFFWKLIFALVLFPVVFITFIFRIKNIGFFYRILTSILIWIFLITQFHMIYFGKYLEFLSIMLELFLMISIILISSVIIVFICVFVPETKFNKIEVFKIVKAKKESLINKYCPKINWKDKKKENV